MKKLAGSTTLRNLTATLVAITLVFDPQTKIQSAAPITETVKFCSESQLRTEAGLYDAAISEISRVATMKLESLDDLKAANAIIGKHLSNLRYNRPKLVVMGLGDSTFIGALREKTRDSSATDAFALEIAKDPNAILRLNGASSIRDRLTRKLDSDIVLLRRVADRLKNAGEAIKARIKPNHSAGKKGESGTNDPRGVASAGSLLPTFHKDDVIVLIAIGVIYFPGVAIALAGPITLVGGVALGATLIGKLVTNIGTEEGRDKLAECQKQVTERLERCVEAGKDLCCGLDIINESTPCLVRSSLYHSGLVRVRRLLNKLIVSPWHKD